ncbi:MAG TPA: hypothetical protein VFI38_10780 [Candidatus Acidoferrum sp.]|nr:hypothetical protein [Candidatus Acidoferrum sp.]
MNNGRLECRIPIGTGGQLENVGNPHDSECAWIENISNRGARIISRRPWRSGDRLLITSRRPPFRSTIGSVIYCETLLEGLYAIGCETPEGAWLQMLEQVEHSRAGNPPNGQDSIARSNHLDSIYAKY